MISELKDFSLKAIQDMPVDELYNSAKGPLPYTMTNDAVFHMVFEANSVALKGLLCSLLHMQPEEISSVEVTNPLQYDASVEKKKFVLDLKILLNNSMMINIEMQVEKLKYWKERSITYLCRTFDNLEVGEDYSMVMPTIQIGILSFDLFPERPEFYATYYLANEKNNARYSDKFRLSVLQLRQIDIATEEDIRWQLDLWGRFFMAETWEEIRMVAEKNSTFSDAAQTLYRITTNDQVRYMCEAFDEGDKTYRTLLKEHEEVEAELYRKTIELSEKDAEIERLRRELEKLKK